jgi:hypothetical protein
MKLKSRKITGKIERTKIQKSSTTKSILLWIINVLSYKSMNNAAGVKKRTQLLQQNPQYYLRNSRIAVSHHNLSFSNNATSSTGKNSKIRNLSKTIPAFFALE